MPYAMRIAVVLVATATVAAAPATPDDVSPIPEAPDSAAKPKADDLEQAYKQAPLLVEFQVETVQGNPTADRRLAWEASGPVLDVLHGRLLPGRISVHVDSVVRVFDMPRAEAEGKSFVVPLKPLGEALKRRFQVVGRRAYAADSPEADRLRQLAESDVRTDDAGGKLALTVKPLQPVFPVEGPKHIEVRLTNEGKDSATYVQAPLTERGGTLYLPGKGRIHIRTMSGEPVPDKGSVVTGMVPPGRPEPALILPRASFKETIDLDTYYTLPAGRYTFSMFLATPDGRGRIASNGFSFQVGAVGLPETPERPAPAETPDTRPDTERVGPAAGPTTPTDEDLPDPHSYTPGETAFGLASLLRPTQAVYTLGEPVTVELRLINAGPRTVAVDPRLERTLTVRVEPVGDSPQPLMIRQVIPWPDDETVPPEMRATLRESAFWGRTINLNTLYGRKLEAIEAPTPKEIAEGKALKYERFGRNLFGFKAPGTYKVSATYAVGHRKNPGGAKTQDQTKTWWTGDVRTNTITIRIAEKKAR